MYDSTRKTYEKGGEMMAETTAPAVKVELAELKKRVLEIEKQLTILYAALDGLRKAIG